MQQEKTAVRYAHPVEPAVRSRVLETLAEIEAEHDVQVVFACESGSRGWGFASPDSDYDVRFVYVHRLPWYLRVDEPRDVIERPISDELDLGGWELRKALGLLRRSNPTLYEWLDSSIVYREEADAAGRLRALAPGFFSPLHGRHHYLAMARKNHAGHLQGETVRLKKYFYVLRPLLAVRWIDQGRGMPPMRFADLVAATVDDAALIDEIDRLLAVKMAAGEAEAGPRWPLVHAFIEAELERETQRERRGALQPFAKSAGDPAKLDAYLMQTVLARSLE